MRKSLHVEQILNPAYFLGGNVTNPGRTAWWTCTSRELRIFHG